MKTIFKNLRQPSLKITMIPRRNILTEGGVLVQNTNFKMIEFHDGIYETDDKKEIDFLRGRIKLNANIIEISPEEQKAIRESAEDEREAREIVAKKRKEREARKK